MPRDDGPGTIRAGPAAEAPKELTPLDLLLKTSREIRVIREDRHDAMLAGTPEGNFANTANFSVEVSA